MATRWGIVTAGKISHDFVTALGTLPAEEHVVVAVAARSLDSAKSFAKLHGISTAYDSYEKIAKDPKVDVVYIGSISSQHLPLAKMMLENGKPVLCEKPLTVNLRQSTELVNLARKKNLFLMEAVWSRCFPSYRFLKEKLESGVLGEISHVFVNFGVPIQDIERLKYKELGGGTILDLGVYTIQLALLAYGLAKPEILAAGRVNEHGCDIVNNVIMTYKNGQSATFSCNGSLKLPNAGYIVGTKGCAKIEEPFWCPTKVTLPNETFEFKLPEAAHPFNYDNSAGLRYEAMEVRRCLQEGLIESPTLPHKESLLIAEIQDEVRKQLNVVFPEDGVTKAKDSPSGYSLKKPSDLGLE